MGKIKYLIICFILLVSGISGINQGVENVKGAGISTLNIGAVGGVFAKQMINTVWATWDSQSTASSCDAVAGPAGVTGWSCRSTGDGTFNQIRSILAFDVSSVPMNVEITAVELVASQYANISAGPPSDYWPNYLTYYKTMDSSHSFDTNDWGEAYFQGRVAVFQPHSKFLATTQNYTYEMYPGFLSTFLSWQDGFHYIYFTEAMMRSMVNYPPTYQASAYYWVVDLWIGAGATHYLAIHYIANSIPRVMIIPANAPDYPAAVGNETADNLTWLTPRCAYADEALGFQIDGMPGANLTLNLMAESGAVLYSKTASVKTDNHYYYTVPSGIVAPGYSGWVRVQETHNQLVSLWGRIEPSPSASEKNLTVYAKDTTWPQYDNPFSDYAVFKNGLMFVHWKTNIESGNVTNYGLRILVAGDNISGIVFNHTFDYLNSSYFLSSVNNTFATAWRYMIFTPQIFTPGFDSRNSLIYDLGLEYTNANTGFLEPIITLNSDGSVLTTTHSAYFYINGLAQGVDIGLNADMTVTITVGQDCKVADKLSGISVEEIDSGGSVLGIVLGSAIVGQTNIILPPLTYNGDYQARVIFADSVKSPYYAYIHDVSFNYNAGTNKQTPAGPGGQPPSIPGWQTWLKGMLGRWGMDNEAGHALLVFVIAVILALVFRKHGTVATILVVLIFAVAFAFRWINPWFIVLLCIGAGIYIWKMIRGKSSRGAED